MNRAVFLDRDNTLIRNDADLGDPEQVKLIQGAATAVASMRGLGYKIVVVTNQGGVARGKYGEADVEAVHGRISELLKQHANGATVDRYYYCPYHPEGTVPRYRREHSWRKPAPGMLRQGAADLNLDLSLCWMVGDAARDVEAGKAAGVRTIRVPAPGADVADLATTGDAGSEPDFVARNLVEAARIIAQALRPDAAGGSAEAAPRTASRQASDESAAASEVPPVAKRSTYPAVEKLDPTQRPPAREPRVHRPFKPWDIQPVTDSDAQLGEPRTSTARMTQPISRTASEAAAEKPAAASQAAQRERPVAASAPAEPPRAPDEADAPVDEPLDEDADEKKLLGQIVRELRRGRHADHSDWSMHKTLGLGVAQPLAGFCALLGVLNVGEAATMIGWLLGAALLQLLVITLLLLHWQR